MNNGFYYFRAKLAYKGYDEMGGIANKKEEHLIMATTYSEAEQVALCMIKEDARVDGVDAEIIRTKIADVVFNDSFSVDERLTQGLISYYFEEEDSSESGLYAVSLVYYNVDENTGKEKKETETLYVPAKTSEDAIRNTTEYLSRVGESRGWAVRSVKYDKAQSVLVTQEQHKSNISI